jgi:hypothetical protein
LVVDRPHPGEQVLAVAELCRSPVGVELQAATRALREATTKRFLFNDADAVTLLTSTNGSAK